MVPVPFPSIALTDTRTGARVKHCPLGPGAVAVADRGSCHPATMVQTVPRGADVRLRLPPHPRPLSQGDGTAWARVAAVRQQAPARLCTLPVRVGQAAQPAGLVAWVHAYRRPDAQANRARQVGRQRQRTNGHQPKQRPLFWAGWVLGLTSLPPTLRSGPTALAV